MDDLTSGRTLVYKSASIVERRRRILREARRMIVESGIAAFNVRDLCARAGIAQKTLYNAFGSKEAVVTMAIRQYLADFLGRMSLAHEADSIEGRLERFIKIHSRNIQIRPYTSAIMAVYNAPTAAPGVRRAIRELAEASIRPFAEAVARRRNFQPGLSVERYVGMSVTTQYAILTDWSVGEIPDAELATRICEMFLVVLEGATRGVTRREAGAWLQALRSQDPRWVALFSQANGRSPEASAATP